MTSLDTACATEQAIDEYLSDYTMDGDDAFHLPTESELALIKDAIMGLLVDQNFLAAFAPLTEPELRAGIALQLREIERLRVQVKQADERGDEAMRRAHNAESELTESALQVLAHSTQAHEHWEDAQRYQFLRNQPRRKDYYTEDANWSVAREQHGMGVVFRGNELDAAIDAARLPAKPINTNDERNAL